MQREHKEGPWATGDGTARPGALPGLCPRLLFTVGRRLKVFISSVISINK